jgi:hypothetical protein
MKFLFCLLILPLLANDLPFWKKKEAVYKQIKEDRQIIVSANITEKDNEKRLDILSAGHIKSPLAFTWKKVLDFQNYHKITDHFKDIKYDAKKQDLFLKVGALGYYASLWLKLDPKESENKRILDWHCYHGSFKGMKGTVIIEKFAPVVTEISMQSDFSGKTIPIPDILLRFGLELVGKQMASKMRAYIEDSYKNDTSID